MNSSYRWRWAVVALIALTAVGTMGCGRRARRIQNALHARYQQNLVRLAARDTGCPPQALSSGQIAQDVYTVTGCSQPVEYLLACGRRGRRCRWIRIAPLNEAAAAALQCQPQMVQQQPTQMPNTRYAVGCGRQAAFSMQCAGRSCGWAMSGPPQGVAPTVAVQPQGQPAPPQAYVAAPAAQGGAAAVQSQLMTQREAILSCVDVGSINVTVRWTAQGAVQIALPPELVGTAAAGCIQAAVGTLRIVTQQAGEITIPVQ